MSKIFISYARRDLQLLTPLAAKLRQSGFELWIDYESIDPGSEFSQDIEEAVRSVDYVLFIVTAHSKTSDWVRREIDGAVNALRSQGDIRIIPIQVRGESLPEKLSEFQSIHYDSDVDEVAASLLERLDQTYLRELWKVGERAAYAARHGKAFDPVQVHPLQCGACGDPDGLMVHWLVETLPAFDRLDYRPTAALVSSKLLTMINYIFTEKPDALKWDHSLMLFQQILLILNSSVVEEWETHHGSEPIGVGARLMITIRLPETVLFFAAGHVSGLYFVDDEALAREHPELGGNGGRVMRSQILRPGIEAKLGRSVFNTDVAYAAPIGHIESVEEVTPSSVKDIGASRCIYQMVNTLMNVEDMDPMMRDQGIDDLAALTKALARYGANKVRARTGRRAEVLAVGALA